MLKAKHQILKTVETIRKNIKDKGNERKYFARDAKQN